MERKSAIGRGSEATVYRISRSTARSMCGDACTSTSCAKLFAVRALHRPAPCLRHGMMVSAMARHPHVASVYAVEEATGQILLEYIGGGTLAAEVQAGAVSGARAMCVMGHILQGLCHLHSYGCIHGDINPSNVLVSTGSRACKLIDYFTASPRLGAPAYMAPEAVRGETTCLSDVWSCGCVMLCLEGLPPWQREADLGDGGFVVIREAPALMYHLGCRAVAMHGPPERKLACVFRAFVDGIFADPGWRSSVAELLELHAEPDASSEL